MLRPRNLMKGTQKAWV